MRRSAKRGFTLIEIMIVIAIIALLAAIAIPNVLRGRTSANETASIQNLRALVSSLEMFRSVNQAYPEDWDDEMYGAAGNCATGVDPDPDFGPPSFCLDLMATAAVQGYTYDYIPVAGADPQTYEVTSIPVTLGSTGTRGFRVTEAGQIFHCTGGTAPDATITTTVDEPPDPCP